MADKIGERVGNLEKEMVGVTRDVAHLNELHTIAVKQSAKEFKELGDKIADVEKNLKEELNNGVKETIRDAIKASMPTEIRRGFGAKEWTAIITTAIISLGAFLSSIPW